MGTKNRPKTPGFESDLLDDFEDYEDYDDFEDFDDFEDSDNADDSDDRDDDNNDAQPDSDEDFTEDTYMSKRETPTRSRSRKSMSIRRRIERRNELKELYSQIDDWNAPDVAIDW